MNFRVVDREHLEIGNLIEHSLFMRQLEEIEQVNSQKPDSMIVDKKLNITLVQKTTNASTNAIIEYKICIVSERNQSDANILLFLCALNIIKDRLRNSMLNMQTLL